MPEGLSLYSYSIAMLPVFLHHARSVLISTLLPLSKSATRFSLICPYSKSISNLVFLPVLISIVPLDESYKYNELKTY